LRLINARNGNACKIFKSSDLRLQIVEASPAWIHSDPLNSIHEGQLMWPQIYDPFHNAVISTLVAAVPVVVMLAALAFFHIKAHIAALLGLISALAVAILGYSMPVNGAISSVRQTAYCRSDG
jgi:hypothetical protein